MKKVLIVLISIILIFVVALNLPQKENIDYDYLRIHIRANSNLEVDQNIKYKIKDEVVKFLTPYFCSVSAKEDAVNQVLKTKNEIENLCNNMLKNNGFNYTASLKITNEFFPARNYENVTLKSGYYDAVIVELGEAKGDNWWCIMYPPLCFVNKNENTMQIKYKSRILNWFYNLFN